MVKWSSSLVPQVASSCNRLGWASTSGRRTTSSSKVNTFDGKGIRSDNKIWDLPAGDVPRGWIIRNNTFKNFWVAADPSDHSQAIFVGTSADGLIEGNSFINNGTTAHLFFSYWGGNPNPSSSYPRNICVRGNTFGPSTGAPAHFFALNFRSEIPVSSGIRIAPGRERSHYDEPAVQRALLAGAQSLTAEAVVG